jgi:fluoride ion exporter CrcB/FEX
MQYGFLKALINWTGTLALSFTMYQIGRLIALKWKSGAKFSFDLLNMENEDRRIQHEVEKEELRRLNEETILNGTNYGSQTNAFTKLTKLEQHLVEQMDKKRRHITKHMRVRHVLIIVATLVFVLANFIAVGILQYTTWNTEQNIFAYDFCISLLMCVLGALAGRYIRMIGKPDRRGQVQWGTFRVNMLSCIIIGTAHNILLLRRYIYGDSPHLTIVFQRLIGNFCGAESNFGGFIDETTVLWNSKGCRVEAVRNFFYNLILCTIVFFMVVLSVRLAFFYDVRILV